MSVKNPKISAKAFLRTNREAMNTRTAKVGGYTFLLTLILLGILIAVNVFVNLLPSNLTQLDISAAQLYSVTSSTKVVANNLDEDVAIYWIVQSGQEDSVLEKLLNVYASLSDHITVTKKDPDAYPTFAAQYTDSTSVNNNSLVVCSEDKYRFIDYSDIYEVSYDTSSYSSYGYSVSQSFDGEGEITAAIDYVVKDDLPQIYVLTGHGEGTLSDDFTSSITRANMETVEFSLLNVDEIPEEADCIMIYAPTSDLSEEEADMLLDYVTNGGNLMVYSGPQEEEELTNLNSVLNYYGVTVEEGIVVEGNRDYYAFSAPYVLLPEIESSDITDALNESNNYVILPIAQGLSTANAQNGTVTALFETSSDSYSKVDGYSITTYEKEDNDLDGPFTLAVSIEDGSSEGKIVWVASDYMMDATYNSYSSGANSDFGMNALSWMVGEEDQISIRSKSMDATYLTINETVSGMLKIWMIGVVPLAYLAFGIIEVVARRKEA